MRLLKYILFTTFFFICSCTEEIEDPTKNLGSIAGIVADKVTGAPVPIVNLKLDPGGKSTVTGTDGTYLYKDLTPGVYTIQLSKDGYKNNTGKLTVAAGIQTEGDLLIERIPATITVDKKELDFGIDQTLNSLSFSVVNNDYSTLIWNIGGLEDWIKVDPISGELAYGKTATVIVTINRNSDKIKPGTNSSVIVIRSSSGHGSTEVAIKVTGEVKEDPSVNILDATQVTSSSVTLNGLITNPGTPSYIERGFYYSKVKLDTVNIDNSPTIYKVSCPVNDNCNYSYTLTELQTNNVYYARSYVINRDKRVLSTNEISFKPSATVPIFIIKDVSEADVSKRRAQLNGEVIFAGDPSLKEKGFVYSEKPLPTIIDTRIKVDGKAEGDYSVSIRDLDLDTIYYVRAYVIQMDSIYYSSETKKISLATISPTFTVQEASSININKHSAVLNGIITSTGTPSYTEKGFVYSLSPAPTVNDTKVPVEGVTTGNYSVSVTGLEWDKTYYVRAYVMHMNKTYYSNETTSFTLSTTTPTVSIQQANSIDVQNHSAILNATVTEKGNPAYSEKGFVYSLSPTPTVNDSKVPVEGVITGNYSVSITNLEIDKIYFVRAFIRQLDNIYYSTETVTITMSRTIPILQMKSISNLSYSTKEAKLSCTISEAGIPTYSKRGFVYGFESNPTVENDKSQAVSGTGTGDYSLFLTNLTTEKQYFVRAYVEQDGKTYYSNNELGFTLLPLPVQLGNISVSEIEVSTAKVTCSITDRGDPIYSEKGFVYNENGNPHVENNLGIIKVEGDNSGDYSGRLSQLNANATYYVKAYVKQNGNTYYSAEVSFKTNKQAPTVTTNDATDIQYTTAALNANISFMGNPIYNKRGFYLSTSSTPTAENGTVLIEESNTQGEYSIIVNNLQENTKYYYRAYVLQPNETTPTLGNVTSFTTGKRPTINTYDAIDLVCTGTNESDLSWSATLRGNIGQGNPAPTTCGFVYGTTDYPTIDDGNSTFITHTNNSGTITSNISGFKTNVRYRFRTVAITPYGYIYGDPKEFTPKVVSPSLKTYSVSSLTCSGNQEDNLNWTAKFEGEVLSQGNPVITGSGFVYGTTDFPTVGDGSSTFVSHTNTTINYFSTTISGLETNVRYRYRTVAVTPAGYFYGEPSEFTPIIIRPTITTNSVDNIACTGTEESNLIWSASFNGSISSKGNPPFSSRGFVYGTTEMPTVNDGNSTFIPVAQNNTGKFSTDVNSFIVNTRYRVRAVAVTQIGYVYGDPVEFTPKYQDPIIITYDVQQGAYTSDNVNYETRVTLYGKITNKGLPAVASFGFVHSTTNNNPTVGGVSCTDVPLTMSSMGQYASGASTNTYTTTLTFNSTVKTGKIYYVRAYVKTPLGYYYGEVATFQTPYIR